MITKRVFIIIQFFAWPAQQRVKVVGQGAGRHQLQQNMPEHPRPVVEQPAAGLLGQDAVKWVKQSGLLGINQFSHNCSKPLIYNRLQYISPTLPVTAKIHINPLFKVIYKKIYQLHTFDGGILFGTKTHSDQYPTASLFLNHKSRSINTPDTLWKKEELALNSCVLHNFLADSIITKSLTLQPYYFSIFASNSQS
jgi:hypothetical protein